MPAVCARASTPAVWARLGFCPSSARGARACRVRGIRVIGWADHLGRRSIDVCDDPPAQRSAAIAACTFDSPTSAAITTWITAPSADGQTTIAWCESPLRRFCLLYTSDAADDLTR